MRRTWALMVLGVVFAAGLAAAAEAPVGKWQTIDEKTDKPVSEVQITEQGGKLTGTITGLTEPNDKAGKPKSCTACKGDDKDKPNIGLVIIKDLKPDGDRFSLLRPLRAAGQPSLRRSRGALSAAGSSWQRSSTGARPPRIARESRGMPSISPRTRV